MEHYDKHTRYVIEKALAILKQYPLCDRCLGRLFAKLGYGWTNAERGASIKKTLLMELHYQLRNNQITKEEFVKIAENLGDHANPLLKKQGFEHITSKKCAICGGELDEFIKQAAERGIPLLKTYDIKRFVVGARVSNAIINKENYIKAEFGIEYGESIKAEIRREIGKLIQSLSDLEVDFDEPEATLLVEYPSGALYLQINSLLIQGRYWKTGRLISQAYWPTPTGPKYYSIEEALWTLLKELGGERIVLHAAGREDVDARMLGTGRPAIVEIKSPRKRRISLKLLEEKANNVSKYVHFQFTSYASRKDILLYKDDVSKTSKIYKALILLEEEISNEKLQKLEEFFKNRTIMQRTPIRVLHRRPDILRQRKVHEIKCLSLTPTIIECLIKAEGGLYIKELISGDSGRTTPSFSEILNTKASCIELDVISVALAAQKSQDHRQAHP